MGNKIMYRKIAMRGTTIKHYNTTEAETLEMQIERAVNNKEPIKGDAPLIFTERKDGVLPGYNIRTDRFEVALDGMDKVSKSYLARREERQKVIDLNANKAESGGAESTPGTNQ